MTSPMNPTKGKNNQLLLLDHDKLHAEWEKDCIIDDFHLDNASVALPVLHSKYLRLLDIAKRINRNQEFEYANFIRKRQEWYDGILSKEEMDQLGWPYDPFEGKLVKTKSQKDAFFNRDPLVIQSKNKLEESKWTIDMIKEMLDNIKWRSQTIKNIIEWKKFEIGA